MKKRIRTALLLMMDLAMVAMEWPVLCDAWRSSGAWMLRYYTQSSNVLAMIVCGACLLSEVYCLLRDRSLPAWTQIARYISACCLMVTFLVAAFVLVPMEAHNTFRSFMLEGDMLYLHTVCPLLMFASVFVHGGKRLAAKHALGATVPTVIYGAISIVMNIRRVYEGPYPFLRVLRQPVYMTLIWCILIIGGNFAVAWLIARLSGREKSA